jgi:hypothetical protein
MFKRSINLITRKKYNYKLNLFETNINKRSKIIFLFKLQEYFDLVLFSIKNKNLDLKHKINLQNI